MTKLCAVSVDLDPLTAYYQIHGLGDPPPKLRETIMRRVLPRFQELFEELGIPATFFVVGQELEQSAVGQAVVKELAEAGHEIGNHTYTHPYDLCSLPSDLIAAEIKRAEEVIATVVGDDKAPVGFRTPGYGVSSSVLRALVKQGYIYDSSMFPSPPYYLAKAAAMAGMYLRGRRSQAAMGDPRGLTSPTEPYRPDLDQPWRSGHAPLVELPVAVLPWLRLPVIGTLLLVAPEQVRIGILAGIRQRPFFNLELHGIDLADAIVDRIPTELAGRQPDLRVPFADKRRIFVQTVRDLQAEYEFVTLRQVASLAQEDGYL